MVFSRRRWNGRNLALPGGAPFLWRNGGKSTRGCAPGPRGGKSFFPPHPFSLDCCRSGVVLRSSYLACGLQDQRLMARPPARAGGRSGLLTGRRKRETKRLLSAFSQRAPTHVPSPPSRWAGRYQRSNERAAGQVTSEKYSLPHTTPPEKGVPGEEPPPPGVSFPHFFPRNGAPAGQAKVPCRSNGVRKNPQWAPLGRTPFPALPTAKEPHPIPHRVRLSPPPPGPPPAGPPGPRPEYSPGSARPPGERCPGQPPPPGESVKSQSSPPGTSPRPPHWRR